LSTIYKKATRSDEVVIIWRLAEPLIGHYLEDNSFETADGSNMMALSLFYVSTVNTQLSALFLSVNSSSIS